MQHNNIILITGATGNIGGAITRRFSDHGWRVIAPVRALSKPQALQLISLPGLHVAECNIENKEAVQQFVHSLLNAQDIPSHVFQAAGMFLWDNGYPNIDQFATGVEVEDFLIRANCVTKENINAALQEYMTEHVKFMRNDMIGSHAATWTPDDPRRNGKYTEEYYVHSMQRVESHGEDMKKIFKEVVVHHTPLIDTSETRKTFTSEYAPDITEAVWNNAISPQEYAIKLYPDSFFKMYSTKDAA